MQTNAAKLPYLLLAILVAGSALFYVARTAAIFDSFLNPNRARPPLEYSHSASYLIQPLPESRRAGMQDEDEILSVNGVPFTGMAGLIQQTFHARPGEIYLHRSSHQGGWHPYGRSEADGAAKRSSNPLRLADQHRDGRPFSGILSLARILGGAGEAARLECLVFLRHHECRSGLQPPEPDTFPVSSPPSPSSGKYSPFSGCSSRSSCSASTFPSALVPTPATRGSSGSSLFPRS